MSIIQNINNIYFIYICIYISTISSRHGTCLSDRSTQVFGRVFLQCARHLLLAFFRSGDSCRRRWFRLYLVLRCGLSAFFYLVSLLVPSLQVSLTSLSLFFCLKQTFFSAS